MIVDVFELLDMPEFNGQSEKALKRKLQAVESLIRSYTNNNFQNRQIRFEAPSTKSSLLAYHPYLKVGDTIQITESINDGLFVVATIEQLEKKITLDTALFATEKNLVTKVEYPPSIVEGVVTLMKWEVQSKHKIGVQAETLSRHSVTYFSQDANNQLMGYPVALLGFLKPYTKARF